MSSLSIMSIALLTRCPVERPSQSPGSGAAQPVHQGHRRELCYPVRGPGIPGASLQVRFVDVLSLTHTLPSFRARHVTMSRRRELKKKLDETGGRKREVVWEGGSGRKEPGGFACRRRRNIVTRCGLLMFLLGGQMPCPAGRLRSPRK